MYRLSTRSRAAITRTVWAVWILRKSIFPTLLVSLLAIESYFVSIGNVARAAVSSMRSPGSFWAFAYSAVTNTELHVLALTALIFICAGYITRNFAARSGIPILSFVSGTLRTGVLSLGRIRIRRNA